MATIPATVVVEYIRYYLTSNHLKSAHVFDIFLQGILAICIIAAGPLIHKFLNEFSQEALFHFCLMLAYFGKSVEFRCFMGKTIIVSAFQLTARFLTIENSGSISLIILYQLLQTSVYWLIALMCYDRAMYHRTSYNEGRILKIESEKIEETIVKLVPKHIFEGIKS